MRNAYREAHPRLVRGLGRILIVISQSARQRPLVTNIDERNHRGPSMSALKRQGASRKARDEIFALLKIKIVVEHDCRSASS